jgi:hypothetical protein
MIECINATCNTKRNYIELFTFKILLVIEQYIERT